MNKEFKVRILNEAQVEVAEKIACHFDVLLDCLKSLCPEGREFSIAKAKLEEACFFAKKAMACDKLNKVE